MKARQFRRVLERPPLGYEGDRSKGGSHFWLEAEGRPRLRFAFHDGETLPPGLVRDILMKQVGLTEDEALDVLR
jgi:predicted RNA binding protein YcfA (HicA-like mRNA interferase family)